MKSKKFCHSCFDVKENKNSVLISRNKPVKKVKSHKTTSFNNGNTVKNVYMSTFTFPL